MIYRLLDRLAVKWLTFHSRKEMGASFYEEDENPDIIRRRYEEGLKGVTGSPRTIYVPDLKPSSMVFRDNSFTGRDAP